MVRRFYDAWNEADEAEEARSSEVAQRARANATAVAREYEAATPIVALSRSPYDGQVFESSLDNFGLDGMWWAYEYDYRPFVPPIRSFFAWTGAMTLDGPVPDVPLKAMVGPEVPFVLPRMLKHPAVRAVVSSVLIGEHVGYPIVYYADPVPLDLERVNDWRHSLYYVPKSDGSPGTGHAAEYDYDKDFELAPWLASGKLQWIAPADLGLTLRTGESGCPYIGLQGERRRQYLQGGERWFAREVKFPTPPR